MRILHLLASPVFSGPAENLALLALAQRRLGHQVSVAVDRKRARLPDEEPSVPHLRALGLLDEGGLELSVKSAPWAVVRDVRRLRARSLDVVHAHFSHDHWVARWGRPKGTRLVRSIHAERSLKKLLPHADGFTVPTQRLKGSLRAPAEVLPPLLSERFVPADRSAARRELSLEANGRWVGMVSHFQPSRRHALGLSAFAQLHDQEPDTRMVLVGDGPQAPALRALTQALGIASAVTFAGYQSGDGFVRYLQCMDEVWILGLGNDESGRTARQARACGARVIAVNEGGLADHAHALVEELTAAAVLAARLRADRPLATPPSNLEIAERILSLYEAPASPRRQPSSSP